MSETLDEEAFAKEGKYQKFQYAVERALKNFELSSQWTDLVSNLSTLHKVLLAYTQYPVVPLKYQLNRRLSKCLHYKLPHGVHLKTLDVYCAIFDRIKLDGLSADLHVYCSGLFPLMSFANINVRTKLLDVYEKYLLPLGHKLVPALSGFVLGLLPGLEENSDHSDKILGIIEKIWHEIGRTELMDALWNSIILSSSCRVAALNLVSTKLQQEQRNNKEVIDYDKPLSRAAFQAALSDSNTYAQRMALDLILVIYSFDKMTALMFSGEHVTMVLCPALCVLLQRDQSLTRRVYCWLLGDGNSKEENLTDPHNVLCDKSECYFDTKVRTHVISALRLLLNTKDIVSCLKIVQFLFDKTSICDSIKETIMLDMVWGLYKQSLVVGELKLEEIHTANKTKKKNKAGNKIGLLRAVNLLFQTFGEHFVWKWLEQFLKQSCDLSGCHSNGTIDEEMTVTTVLQVMLFLVKLLPLESYGNHLSSLLIVLLNILLEHYGELMKQGMLIGSLTVVKSLICLLHNQSLQKLSAPPSKSTTPISSRDSSSSPDNVTNEITKQAEQNKSGDNCDCKNIVSMADIVKVYLVLFPKLIFDACKLNHFDQSKAMEWEGSKEAIECCQFSSDLLVDFLSLPLSANDFDIGKDNHQTLPDWLNGLFTCCVIKHNIHGDDDANYRHMMLWHISIFCHLLEECSSAVMSQQMKSYIFHHTKFCQQISRILYNCLLDVKLQPGASRLLHKLHTLVRPLAVCEMVILGDFSNNQCAVKPYQCYAVICQYTPHCKTASNQPRPFLRVGLRMLEGLQSSYPTVRSFVQHWVEHTCRKGNAGVLLAPILALLHEIPIRRQHYKIASSRTLNTCYQLKELVDTRRACFALNILTSLLEVGGAGLLQHFVGTTKQQQPQQSMLQDLLSLLMSILLADYSERMDLSQSEIEAGFTMKCAVCNCLNEMFINFVKAIKATKEDSNNNSGSGFFLGLLFLCEVQKLLLLMLCELQEGLQKADSPSHESKPLLHSLLQAIGQILIVESLSVLDESSSNQKSFTPKKLSSALTKRTFIEANPLCSQPLFYALIMDACKNGQFCFLDMTLKYLPYFNPAHMIPQLLSIICELLKNSPLVDCNIIHLLFAVVCLNKFVWQDDSPFLTYANLQPLLKYLNVLHFIPTLMDQSIPRFKAPASACDQVGHSSNSGPMSWLFSPIWSQRKSSNASPICDPLQEAVLEQLPQLYQILALLWGNQDNNLKLPWCNLNEPIIFEDVKLLVRELLLSPLSALPEAFMSTLAEMWMNWSSDVTEDRRTNFISLLHTIKLVGLCDLLDHIRKTLLLLGQMDGDAGAVRQKYLLHFLYKYLSSSQQSADVLEQCYSVILTFLKDCHQHLNHPESICLLTSILHVLVCRTTSPVEKKIRRELQEAVHLLCVALSMAAGVATNLGYVWLQRNTAISVPHLLPSSASSTPSSPRSPVHSSSPNLFRDEDTAPSSPTRRESSLELPNAVGLGNTSTLPIHHQLQMPTIQALAVLSNVLSQFVDYVYTEKEKDKITSLLSAILYHVWPHLSDHSAEHQLCYEHSLSLLTSLTDFSVAHKSWKKETAGLFLQPNYFNMPSSCIDSWLTIIDNLMTQDKNAMKSFLSQIKPLSVTLMTKEQLSKLAGLIKRLAFVIFAGEVDQYETLLRDMEDKLLESLGSTVTLQQVLLCYHVMLLRFSPKHLQLIWPTITSESARICHSLFKDLQQLTGIQLVTSPEEGREYSSFKPPSLSQCAVYVNVCQLVHTMLMISAEQLPQFQHVRWYFEGITDDVGNSVLHGINGLCDKLDLELIAPKSLAVKLRDIKMIIKRISNSLTSHKFIKPTSKDLNEIEETLKLMFLTN